MGRTDTRPRDFSAHIEQLEARQVMTADPLGGSMAIEHQVLDAALPAADQQVASSPDFWIDSQHQSSLDSALFHEVEQALAQAHQQTGWNNVQANYGFTGRGQTIAVIDSGVAYNHFALGGGFGAGYRVVGGWDFAENDANPYDDGASGGHGTHVSGIIGSSSGANAGVAPGVDLVGLRVFDDAGAGYFSWVENALRWVHQHRNDFANPITAINLSLGVASWNAATIPAWAQLEDEFAQLEADGIFIAVSAGNSYASYNQAGLSYPAASPYVVPVMSTDDGGSLSSFSQRLSRAIAAPGRNIVSTIPDYKGNKNGVADDFASMSGTSMAAPYVAGASALVRQAMQFAGLTGITQDKIYDHLMATADAVFDAATSGWYKRLDLQAAIDALMPGDDYGSTQGSAHNLGALASSTTVSGAIAKVGDQDFFQFTASSSGRVTFEATAEREEMAATWQAYRAGGQSIAAASGAEFSFDVVAGQTYAVRIGSTAGLGHYTIKATAPQSSFSSQDWGAVAFNQVNNVRVNGEQWYRVQAGTTGLLTVQGAFSAAGGNVNVELYDANMQRIASGATAAGQARVDMQATAGKQYFVRVTGGNSDVDFTLVNLVSQSGSTVTALGTAGVDAFTFSAGATHRLSVNGVAYQFSAGSANKFTFDGGAGADSITLTGTAGADAATLRFGSSSLSGASYTATARGIENVTMHGGGGLDGAKIYDSAGDDAYRTYANRAEMSNQTGSLAAWNFAKTIATASTGNDEVRSYDSVGDDTYRAYSNRVVLAGAGYSNESRGFDNAYAYSSTGIDRAYLYDTAGDDIYRAWPDRVSMTGAGYSNVVHGFEYAYAYACAGNDLAYSYDSAGDDLYRAWRDRVIMSGAGYYNFSQGFDKTYAYGTIGNDASYSYDSAGDDTLRAWANRAVLSGAGFYNYVQDFDKIYTYATVGLDRAYLYDTPGDDLYRAWSNRGVMSGVGFYNYAQDFDNTYAYATEGNDVARVYDSAGDDLYRAWENRISMSGANYYNFAQGFDRTVATTTTGNDQAILYDSSLDDELTVRLWGAALQGGAFYNEVRGFDSLVANGSTGEDDADVDSVDYLFSLIGDWH